MKDGERVAKKKKRERERDQEERVKKKKRSKPKYITLQGKDSNTFFLL